MDLVNACDALLMPGREVHRLSFPFPFQHPCDFEGSNAFLAEQLPGPSAGLMLVHPGMTAEYAENRSTATVFSASNRTASIP